MSDVMQEVNDELRQQRLEAFWIENRNWIIGGIILAILTTAGLTWWRGYTYKQDMARTTQLIAAVKTDDAKALTDFAAASGKNHAALAKFSAAGLHVKNGNPARAVEIYGEIAGSMSVNRELRDLAKILSLNIRLGTEDPKKLHKELADMSGNKEPYRFTALEMDALVYAGEGNMKEAAAKLEAISSSPDAPEDSRLRATTLHEFYAASANENVPFKKDAAADKKPADAKPADKAAKPLMKPALRIASTIALVLALSSCAKVKSMFSDEDTTPPLKGERISVLQLQNDLVPSPELAEQTVELPDAWVNQFWPQRGGYPNHALGQLELGQKLERAWKSSIGDGGDKRNPITATPVVAENTVYALDTEGDLSAFNLQDGKRKWRKSIVPKKKEDVGALGGGIAYAAGRLYVTNGYKYLQALNPATGAQLWRANLPAPARSAPTVMDDRVYAVTLDNRLSVFNAKDGTPLWDYAGVSETTNLLGSASPAADATLVVLPLSSGEIFGLRPENGQVAWEDNPSAVRRTGSLNSISDIKGLPVIDQNVVYAVSFSGRMVALDQVTGSRIWQREIGSSETPWAAGDTIYVISSEQQLLALTRGNGGLRWITPLPRYEDGDREQPVVWTGPVLAGGRLIAVSSDGNMIEVDPQDGKILRKQELGGNATLPPLVANQTLIVLTTDGVLRAYR